MGRLPEGDWNYRSQPNLTVAALKVKLFEATTLAGLETQLNAWLATLPPSRRLLDALQVCYVAMKDYFGALVLFEE